MMISLKETTATIFLFLMLAVNAAARPTLSLDGTWRFHFSPGESDAGQQLLDSPAEYKQSIQVPGSWDAQGIGEATSKMRHNAIGIGWYRKTFSIPADWRGKQIWLVIGGVHRNAKVWVNGHFIGEHAGYPVGFKFNITEHLVRGEQSVVIAVDSRHDWSRDPLIGTFDVIDFMDLDWGGIQEHVRLEATGQNWMEDVFVDPDPLQKLARVELLLAKAPGNARLDCRVTQRGKTPLATSQVTLNSSQTNLLINLADAPLWTPEKPNLLQLHLALTQNGQLLDEREITFGLRRLEIKDGRFVLNGSPFYLRGYGDDFNFPRELLPPASKAFWKNYLQKRKDFGFNAVRHHSMMPTESYLEAADEVGILVQPELPLAYAEYLNRASPASYAVYKEVWRDYIRQMRNHPSVLSWCMGNEQWGGVPFGPDLYATAKKLDPTRPVIDTDGLGADGNRPTLDYRSVQFDEHAIPWGEGRAKYALQNTQGKPVIVHEMGNFCCLPDPAEARQFDGTIKPFWLDAMHSAVERQHLAKLLPNMLQASWKLQASLIKLNIEAARASRRINGYYQWLFRDYWCQSSGIESITGKTRALTESMARQFNSPAVILWRDRQANVRAGQTLPISLFLSDYRETNDEPLTEMYAQLNGVSTKLKPPANTALRGLIGPWTGLLTIPDTTAPRQLQLSANAGQVNNTWPIWVWPAPPSSSGSAIITPLLTSSILEQLTNGARVFLTAEPYSFPKQTASFKTAWWKGDARGDFVYGNMFTRHPALAGFPNHGYGDLQAYELLNKGRVVDLDEIPGHIQPIVWALDTPETLRRLAYLWEARVGKGRLLVSGFNLSAKERERDPAVAWMQGALRRYVASDQFQPKAELDPGWLKARVEETQLPDLSACINGFDKMLSSTAESAHWRTDREENASIFVVRQDDGHRSFAWKTARLPANWTNESAVFIWSGGMGFASEPDKGSFELKLNDEVICIIPFVRQSSEWPCKGGGSLRYCVTYKDDQDTVGLFFLTIPKTQITNNDPLQLSLSATGSGSHRWISVAPYRNVVEWLRGE